MYGTRQNFGYNAFFAQNCIFHSDYHKETLGIFEIRSEEEHPKISMFCDKRKSEREPHFIHLWYLPVWIHSTNINPEIYILPICTKVFTVNLIMVKINDADAPSALSGTRYALSLPSRYAHASRNQLERYAKSLIWVKINSPHFHKIKRALDILVVFFVPIINRERWP